MLDNIKQHSQDAIVKIGSGTYSSAYKFYYNRDICKTKLCCYCGLYYLYSGTYIVKETELLDKYTENDFKNEIKYHTQAYSYMPNCVVKLYEKWLESKTCDDQVKPCAYMTLEYMNYKDLYMNYATDTTLKPWYKPINFKGLLLICLYILYNLHCKLNICHGDFRDTNILLSYVGPEYKQRLTITYPVNTTIDIDTCGFHIKISDFGLAEKLILGHATRASVFVYRDFEFLENIYMHRELWKHMTNTIDEYNNIIEFLETEFIKKINVQMLYAGYDINDSKSRNSFWYNKHIINEDSIYLYDMPRSLLARFITLFYPANPA